MISDLEKAVSTAGKTLRDIEFGKSLRRWSPSLRCARKNEEVSEDCTALADTEVRLGMGPPIRSTFAAVEYGRIIEGQDLERSDPEYMAWVRQAHWALQRIAGKCWNPIPQRLRTAVLDVDEFNPLVHYYIPRSRENRFGPALSFEDLDGVAASAALTDVAFAARETSVHRAVFSHLPEAAEDGVLLRKLTDSKAAVLGELEEEQLNFGELKRNLRERLNEAYSRQSSEVAEVAQAIRAANELINHVLCVLLTHAGSTTEIVQIREGLGSVRVSDVDNVREKHFTFEDHAATPFILNRPPFGFEVLTGGPLDGIYVTTGSQFQFSGSGLVDVTARRLADLE